MLSKLIKLERILYNLIQGYIKRSPIKESNIYSIIETENVNFMKLETGTPNNC